MTSFNDDGARESTACERIEKKRSVDPTDRQTMRNDVTSAIICLFSFHSGVKNVGTGQGERNVLCVAADACLPAFCWPLCYRNKQHTKARDGPDIDAIPMVIFCLEWIYFRKHTHGARLADSFVCFVLSKHFLRDQQLGIERFCGRPSGPTKRGQV